MYHSVIANNGQNKAHSAFRCEMFVKSYDTESEEAVVFAVAFLGSLYQLNSYPFLFSLSVSSKYAIFYFTKYFENFL
jgi:hypothetical protein